MKLKRENMMEEFGRGNRIDFYEESEDALQNYYTKKNVHYTRTNSKKLRIKNQKVRQLYDKKNYALGTFHMSINMELRRRRKSSKDIVYDQIKGKTDIVCPAIVKHTLRKTMFYPKHNS